VKFIPLPPGGMYFCCIVILMAVKVYRLHVAFYLVLSRDVVDTEWFPPSNVVIVKDFPKFNMRYCL
jgi:hypothetical protein